MRDFWRSQHIGLGEFATRFAGSFDLFGDDRRRPTASVNIITVHDGFTLRDLVSYDGKHNEANGESNRDGADDNRSWNSGFEGVTSDPSVLALRGQRSRAMLCTLMLSFGVPLLLGGDEIGRTQGGNNNAYCQDNEISWVDWSSADSGLLAFTRSLIALRRDHPVFRRHRYLTGVEAAELGWYTPDGKPMTQECWDDLSALALGVYLDGSDAPDLGPDGQPLLGDDFLVLVNGWWEAIDFTIPDVRAGVAWHVSIDTFDPAAVSAGSGEAARRPGEQMRVGPRSVLVLRGPRAGRAS
jgi:glycogen operon protein